MYRVSFVSILALVASGCGGPASEDPVDLEPGRYEIQAVARGLGGESKSESLCILPDRATKFTDNPLQGIGIKSSSECPLKTKREGNAFSGSQSCTTGSSETGMASVKLDYEGSLTRNSFTIEGNTQLEVEGRNAGGSFSVTGKRSGDC